jgi:AP endonuclease-1
VFVNVAGTAILSKKEPLSITKSLPGHPDASAGKGRIVTLEFEKCYVVGTYVTNAGEKLKVSLDVVSSLRG